MNHNVKERLTEYDHKLVINFSEVDNTHILIKIILDLKNFAVSNGFQLKEHKTVSNVVDRIDILINDDLVIDYGVHFDTLTDKSALIIGSNSSEYLTMFRLSTRIVF